MTLMWRNALCPIWRDRCLLLVQSTLATGKAFWVLPGGGREAGESDAEAVLREVREELGVEVDVGGILDDVPADPPDGTYTQRRTFACARDLRTARHATALDRSVRTGWRGPTVAPRNELRTRAT